MRLAAAALIVLALTATSRADEMRLEIIALNHRTVGDVLPVLEPLIVPGGTVAGLGNQLILRTTPANLEEIKRVLGALDEPLRNLRITVRQGLTGHGDLQEDALSARVKSGNFNTRIGERGPRSGASIGYRDEDAAVRYRTLSTSSQYDENNTHFVQTVEGRPAFINTGQSIPYPNRSAVATPQGVFVNDSIDYREIGSGFYVTPRVQGDRVTLEIAPQLERLDPSGRGAIDIHNSATTISGSLGEWIAVSRAIEDTTRHDGTRLSHTRRDGRAVHDVWVKVDEID